jgi:hypothetical protein
MVDRIRALARFRDTVTLFRVAADEGEGTAKNVAISPPEAFLQSRQWQWRQNPGPCRTRTSRAAGALSRVFLGHDRFPFNRISLCVPTPRQLLKKFSKSALSRSRCMNPSPCGSALIDFSVRRTAAFVRRRAQKDRPARSDRHRHERSEWVDQTFGYPHGNPRRTPRRSHRYVIEPRLSDELRARYRRRASPAPTPERIRAARLRGPCNRSASNHSTGLQ